MLKEIAIKYIFQETIKSTIKYLRERKIKINNTEEEVRMAITNHLSEIDTWSKEIKFTDLKKTKLTKQVFIDVEISLMPRKTMMPSEKIEKVSSQDIFSKMHNHLVILGQPGAGKTTLMKYWCHSILWDENFYKDVVRTPLLIRLKELNDSVSKSEQKNPIFNTLFEILGLQLANINSNDNINDEDVISRSKEKILFSFLPELRPLIVLEGFDEITSDKLRKNVLSDFIKLVLNLDGGIAALTCRSSDFNYSLENTSVLEICPLDDSQIKSFALKWLEKEDKAIDFLFSLKESPFADTAIRPLTISHLCAIYERVGKIPDKPKTIYKKIINLLLEEWDEQRGIKRLSAYGGFEIDRKLDFLCRIAYEITIAYKKSSFTEELLQTIFKDICIDFGLKMNDASAVVNEIESHTGLIIQSRYKQYEFAHKSLHEFLCAEHIVKLPSIPTSIKLLSLVPNELAIATTISSNPSLYFCELVFERFYSRNHEFSTPLFSGSFISTFVNRLVLEKPDFNLSEKTSFALVILYTLFRQESGTQLKLFESDLPIQFEKFVALIFERNEKFNFKKFYEIDETLKSENTEPIYKLSLREQKHNFKNYSLPSYLYAKSAFLNLNT